MKVQDSFSDLAAEQRAVAVTDPGTSSALAPGASRGGALWIGKGKIDRHAVLLAFTDGRHRGGSIGIEESQLLGRLVTAAERRGGPLIICWDTGGVRVQEGTEALATASAAGVALTRLALLGIPIAAIVSEPRGCFGAPAVISATAHTTIMTAGAQVGMTGPKLLDSGGRAADEKLAREGLSARHRVRTGQASVIVADDVSAVRSELVRFLRQRNARVTPLQALDASVQRTAFFLRRLRADRAEAGTGEPAGIIGRQRDLLRYSFRGHWRPTGPTVRRGHVHAAWGELYDRPAMCIIVGPERSVHGIGIEDAHTVTEMVRFAVRQSRGVRAPILTFLFCRAHANDLHEERAGLHCALAECLRSFVTARLLGHPLLCTLGGGAYGAAYLAFAAPSHRILGIRGTMVAPMAPRVLTSFRRLRGIRDDPETPQNLAHLIPHLRIVESVVRLPRALHEELDAVRRSARTQLSSSDKVTVGDIFSR
jgi:acetyl-CoA carboxylase alpha subunit